MCQHYRCRDDTEAQRLDRLRSGRYTLHGLALYIDPLLLLVRVSKYDSSFVCDLCSYLPLLLRERERPPLPWSSRPPCEKILRDISSRPLTGRSVLDIIKTSSWRWTLPCIFPFVVHVPCGSFFDCLVDVWFDLFLSVSPCDYSSFSLVFFVFFMRFAPIVKDRPPRVLPYIIFVSEPGWSWIWSLPCRFLAFFCLFSS